MFCLKNEGFLVNPITTRKDFFEAHLTVRKVVCKTKSANNHPDAFNGHPMKIGYARVSTEDQNLALQLDALSAADCERVFEDKWSGAKADRPGLAKAIAFARPGDVLVVWRLDRLGRSLPDLVRIIGELEQSGISFESVTERIETGTAAGRLVFHVFAALAEFERNITRERTLAGLAAARERGRSGGRPGIASEKLAALKALAADPKKKPGEICKALGISRATFYKYVPSRTETSM